MRSAGTKFTVCRSFDATLRSKMLLCASITALALTAAPVRAQEQAHVVNVVLSASRITAAGFNAPTPTTVLSSQDIEAQGESNVFNAVVGGQEDMIADVALDILKRP